MSCQNYHYIKGFQSSQNAAILWSYKNDQERRSSLRSSVLPASPFPFLSSASQCVTSLHWASESLSSAHYHQVTSASWGCWQPAVSFLLMLSFLFPSSLMLSSHPMYLLLWFNTQLLVNPLPPTIWCFTCSFRFFSSTITSSFLALSEKAFPVLRQNLPCFSLCPLLVTGQHWKEPGSLFFTPSLQILVHIDETSQSLLFSTLNNPSFLNLLSQERCSSPSKNLLSFAGLALIYLFGTGEPWAGPSIPNVGWLEERDHLTWLAGNAPSATPTCSI